MELADKMRIVQELVPGKQVTLAHVIANPDPVLYQKLGLDPATDYTKAALEAGEVLGFFERDDSLAEAFLQKHDLPRFSSLEELLQSEAEGVIVCSATCDHTEDIIRIAKAKKQIFTEKVLALTDEECARIEQAVTENGVSLTISLVHKYHRPQRKVCQIPKRSYF